MISFQDKALVISLIKEATKAGARQSNACELLGISHRTFQRWLAKPFNKREDQRLYTPKVPINKLSEKERHKILAICNSPENGSLPPSQIVPMLADKGEYVASESTFYRVLRESDQLKHRGRSRTRKHKKPEGFVAKGPNQIWSWDISVLQQRMGIIVNV